ncbi:MAG: alpha-glucosidase C-terminal domain-containing protein [Ignavibacteriae bacterium]|nr:alpha-glucosidase C-terminal domain-containing protein [Ignavibacteriota bacterium]
MKNPYKPKPYVELKHPEWSKNSTIYEVNIRQYTKEGTFAAFEKHLPRLKKLGVDILWLMPIHPIGEVNRKGTLGSYYSVKDYFAVNPEFGRLKDFKKLVNKIHKMGMYVIIDWVANHSAWDNKLAVEHPDWYTKNKSGNFQPTPWYDWDDIIDFNYDKPELRKYMTEALIYWVKETNIDGYRCDVAGFLPNEFWENVRFELEKIKPVFMLAEWESRDLHKNTFDMTYAWSLYDKMKDAYKSKSGSEGIIEYLAHDVNTFPKDGYRMTFVENHDKNSWFGNQFTNFGKSLNAAIVLTCIVNGMPLIYSGQEAGLKKSLKFFDKDFIEWKEHEIGKLYKKLFDLKHKNQALWNGNSGGEMIRIINDQPEKVISFYREKNGDKVLLIINFSAVKIEVNINLENEEGSLKEIFLDKTYKFEKINSLKLKPWGYLVFTNNKKNFYE